MERNSVDSEAFLEAQAQSMSLCFGGGADPE